MTLPWAIILAALIGAWAWVIVTRMGAEAAKDEECAECVGFDAPDAEEDEDD